MQVASKSLEQLTDILDKYKDKIECVSLSGSTIVLTFGDNVDDIPSHIRIKLLSGEDIIRCVELLDNIDLFEGTLTIWYKVKQIDRVEATWNGYIMYFRSGRAVFLTRDLVEMYLYYHKNTRLAQFLQRAILEYEL